MKQYSCSDFKGVVTIGERKYLFMYTYCACVAEKLQEICDVICVLNEQKSCVIVISLTNGSCLEKKIDLLL